MQTATAVLALVAMTVAQQELVQNPGFESPLSGHWEADGFTISLSSDAHSGQHSLKSSGRTVNHYQGPSLLVNLQPGKLYNMSAYFKQLNDMPGKLFQKYRANVNYQWKDNGQKYNQLVVYHTSVRSTDGWFRVAGFIRAPTREYSWAKLHFQTPDVGIEFLLDDVSITEVADLPNWKQEADQRIQQLRMGDIHFHFTLSPDVSADEIDIQVDHVKHQFGFGTLVKDQWMVDNNHKQYQEMVYDLFNTATTQGVKWLFDKGSPGHPNFHQAMACIDALREKGMLVRAHNMFWGFTKNLPQYIQHMSPSELNATVQDHLRYMVNITKGKADHWDIMNELVHGQWFEEQFNDPFYSEHLFTEVHQLDPKPLLMLNDYSVVARPEIADAYLQQAQRFLSHGVPLQGLGLQGHFHTTVPDPTRMMAYLDHMSQAGLPMWVTEMDVWQDDPQVRAEYYDTVLRVFFSHPFVHGIVFWGFWDQHVVDKRSSLVDGSQMTVNAAGRRYIQLTQEEWSTHVNRSLSSGTSFDLRGFKGDYQVTIRKNGEILKVILFSLKDNDTTVNININSNVEIPPPGVALDSQKDPNGGYMVGTDSSGSSSESGLTCRSYHSHQSDSADESVAESTCHLDDEVMTGCSSLHKNHNWQREGEQIVTNRGQVVCRGVDGIGATGAVQAIARCCRLSGLTCTFRAAGPGQPAPGTTVDSQCLTNESVLGCSAWGVHHNNYGGVLPTNISCKANNNDLHKGVYSYAACCTAPHRLSCTTVTSSTNGPHYGSFYSVSCPSGYTLTGCNYVTTGGARAAGAAASGSGACQAYEVGSLSEGQSMQAVATCCKLI